MSRIRQLLTIVVALGVLTVGFVAPAGATDAAEPPPGAPVDDDSFGDEAERVALLSADARIDGWRLDDELLFAFAYDDEDPYWASLWVLLEEERDLWLPACVGRLFGDDETALFVGGAVFGDRDDGCVMGTIGDSGDVFFSAIELQGESVLTAAMYALG